MDTFIQKYVPQIKGTLSGVGSPRFSRNHSHPGLRLWDGNVPAT